MRRRLLEMPTRQRVYERILRTPGIHLRRLARELDLPMGTLEHHVHLLEHHRIVVAHVSKKRRSLYAGEDHRPSDLPILHCLRQRTWRGLIVALLEEPGLSFQSLAETTGIPSSTLAYHLKCLTDEGILLRHRLGRGTVYEVRDADQVLGLLKTYRPTYRGLSESSLFDETPSEEHPFSFLMERMAPPRRPRARATAAAPLLSGRA